jgi:hypothetical protein
MKIYLVLSSVYLAYMAIVMDKNNWVSLLYKVLFSALAVYGAFETLQAYGYIVRR